MPYVYLIQPKATQDPNLYKIGMTNGLNNEQRFRDYGKEAYLILVCETDYPRTIEKKLIEEFDSMFNKKKQTNEYYYVDISKKHIKKLFLQIFEEAEDAIPENKSLEFYPDNIVNTLEEAKSSIAVSVESMKIVQFFQGLNIPCDSNGLVNITKICNHFNTLGKVETKKRGSNWNNKERTKILKMELAKKLNKSVEEIFYILNDTSDDLKGTYVHPELVFPFLYWLHEPYANDVAKAIKYVDKLKIDTSPIKIYQNRYLSPKMQFTIPLIANPNEFDSFTHTQYDNIQIIRHIPTEYLRIQGIDDYYNSKQTLMMRGTLPRKKTIEDWLNNENTQELLDGFVDMVNTFKSPNTFKKISNQPAIFQINQGPDQYQGYYVHNKLLHFFLYWLDTEYKLTSARMASSFITEFKSKEEELKNLQEELNQLRKDKENAQIRINENTKRIKLLNSV